MGTSRRWLPALLAAGLVACGGRDHGTTELVVYAAASLRDAAADLAAAFEQQQPVDVIYNFAGSNTLAQQIRAAPGADVFLSADQAWVDVLEQTGRTAAGTRRPFLANRLVVIARHDAGLEIEEPRDLAAAFGPEAGRPPARFLALADPRAVPAGRYARAALEGIRWNGASLWSTVAERIAPALDVRAALALVESDPEIAGIVYKTDAMTSEKVEVLCELPSVDTPIRYVAVQIAGGDAPEVAGDFLDFLGSAPAFEIAERYGFETP